MAWLSVDEYSKLRGITATAVYKQIKQDKLITKKGEKGRTIIQTNLNDPEYIQPQSVHIQPDKFVETGESRELEKMKEEVMAVKAELGRQQALDKERMEREKSIRLQSRRQQQDTKQTEVQKKILEEQKEKLHLP